MGNSTKSLAEKNVWRAAAAVCLSLSFVVAGPRMGAQTPDRVELANETVPSQGVDAEAASRILPDAPGMQATADPQPGRNIGGTVTDRSGGVVSGALIMLSMAPGVPARTVTADASGFFSFAGVQPGTYTLTVTAPGFASWKSNQIVLHAGQSVYVPHIVLTLATANLSIDVTLTQYEVAQEQVKAQEKQRVLGIIPNFYVSYVWDAVPLTAGQKLSLAFREAIDPETFVGAAFGAGIAMWQKDYVGYGNGAQGFFTRTAALYGDSFTSSLIAGGLLPAILHQDPRYFYKGTGSKRSRALYALSRVLICRGDNGKWQPNYSNVVGNMMSASISNAYYPPADRGVRLTVVNTSIGFATGAVGNVFQEFFAKEISTGVKKNP
ncbi:MAG: carboxypeptidase-like regulatory domain-containing protein [Acidobacteriota bacterium]|nr:carboxypeptidase-like regulatory domain-containing protein [Acidobacteriota bacterium]